MMKRIAMAAMLVLSAPMAWAEGCPPRDGATIPEVEAMNQMLLDLDFNGFAATVKQQVGTDISASMPGAAELFAKGFIGCTTVVQRRDIGGLVQNLVYFDSSVGPLFVYWRVVPVGAAHRLISFSVNTDMDKVFDHLQ